MRLRAVGVLAGGGGAVYTIPAGVSIADGIKASDAVIPELDVSYFFTRNLAVEAICCVSYHNLFIQGGPLNNDRLAHVWLFPPTLLAQYHWDASRQFQPYFGVGVNYTHFFSQHPDGVVLNNITVHDSWGVAGQVCFDYLIDEHWGFNFDVKKIVMNPHVSATVAPGLVSLGGQANLNPWLIGAGVTCRFGGAA